jgi:hypothetical protein
MSDIRVLFRRIKEYAEFDTACRKARGNHRIIVDDVGDSVGFEVDTAVMYVVSAQSILKARLRFSPLGDGRTLLVIESKESLWMWVQDIIDLVYQLWPDTSMVH